MSLDPTCVGQLIYAARLARNKRAEMLAQHSIYAGQDVLLKSLEKEDGQTMGALATNLDVKPPTITKMVNRMSAQGLVERKASPSDSRQSHVYITQEGRNLLGKINKVWKKADKKMLKGLKPKEQKGVKKAIALLEATLSATKSDGESASAE